MTHYIQLVINEDFYTSGFTQYLTWDYMKYPHMVLFGSTGSGKTYLLKILLARIGKHIPESEIILYDFKADQDFSFADGCSNFYRFEQCMQGLDYAVDKLHQRQLGIDTDNHFIALVFDEWASFINNLDKKSADSAKQKLSTLLMLARSFHIHVIISQQRLDSHYFNSSRDNFSVIIGMGTLSKESVEMMFSEYKDIIQRNKLQGHGSMILGNQMKNIIVPKVTRPQVLESYILSAVTRKRL